MNFTKKLEKIQEKNNSLVCVGLDSNYSKIPNFVKKSRSVYEGILYFNKQIIDMTYDLVCAYKPNLAFYEAQGADGFKALKETISYIRKKDEDIVIIADAKRADIGSTNKGYVKALFNYFGFNAVTLHPYLGQEALEPFLKLKDRGFIILCRTSNPGAGEFQDLICNDEEFGRLPLYKIIAHRVSKYWNKNNNCLLVVGATYPDELAEVRKIVGDMDLLIPGIGRQGGDVKKTVKAGKNSKGRGMIINSSRSIIFASNEKDFTDAARRETEKLKKMINKFL